MSITAVPISMRLVRAPIAASSGNGEASCRAKWWTRTNAPSTPISSAATASSTVWRSASPALLVMPPSGCQCPNERNPMRFGWLMPKVYLTTQIYRSAGPAGQHVEDHRYDRQRDGGEDRRPEEAVDVERTGERGRDLEHEGVHH